MYQKIQDLVSDDLHHFEGLGGGDRIHEHVAMNPNGVLGVQDAIFILIATNC